MSACSASLAFDGSCPPLLVMGVLSAQDYSNRRIAIRSSWGRYEHIKSGQVLLRFLIGYVGNEPEDKLELIRNERRLNSDIEMLEVGATGRKLGPMLVTFAWLQHSTSTSPYREAAYVSKLDDDCYINVPELVSQLRLLAHIPKVYYGIFFFSTWQHLAYHHHASSYTPGQLHRDSGACIRSGNCSHPFPFAAAPAQILSTDLATAIATSPMAKEYTINSLSVLHDPKVNASRAFATEDAWIGYAIHDLLPTSFGGITIASIDRFSYTFDNWGAELRNTTLFLHNKVKDIARIPMAYHYMRRYACPSNVSISCGGDDKATNARYVRTCKLRPNNDTCLVKRLDVRKTDYAWCQYLSLDRLLANRNLSQFCLGQRDDLFESNISAAMKRW